MSIYLISLIALVLAGTNQQVCAEDVPFSPCPLLGPRFPLVKNISSSQIIQSGLVNLTEALDEYVSTLNGTYGPTSATLSYSIALFSTEDNDSSSPMFYEYHHMSDTFTNDTSKQVDKNTVYPIGDLTTLFTTWLFLIEAGEEHWSDSVSKWVPELMAVAQNISTSSTVVAWKDVTLGDLAAHLGGIGRYNPSDTHRSLDLILTQIKNVTEASPCQGDPNTCERETFLSSFGRQHPIFAPGTTPIFSNAGFIILAYALESIKGRSYHSLLREAILEPLNLNKTSYLSLPTTNNTVVPDQDMRVLLESIDGPFSGLYSSVHDVSRALSAVLSSKLLPSAATRRWLKPTSHTSNLKNSVGRPWEIFSLTQTPISPVIPVYQVRGNIDRYASHVGLVPDYNVGFVILAADVENSPDLNAYADIIAEEMIPALEQNAIVQASMAFSGTYYAELGNTSLSIAAAQDSTPGLSVKSFAMGETDVRAVYAELNRIEPENLSFRLYPTDIVSETARGKRMAFRASFQDVTALADAGTPTCETWRYIDELQVNGIGLDKFVFDLEDDKVVSVDVPALNARLVKQSARHE